MTEEGCVLIKMLEYNVTQQGKVLLQHIVILRTEKQDTLYCKGYVF